MTKRPAFQFYPSDWRNDPGLRLCSAGARGLWIDMLCLMHEGEPYGHLTVLGRAMSPEALAKLVGESASAVKRWVEELRENEVFSETGDGVIFSRRMVRDEGIRDARATGGAAGAEHGAKGAAHGRKGGRPRKVTGVLADVERGDEKPPLEPPPSSSSSSSDSDPNGSAAVAAHDWLEELRALDLKTGSWRLALRLLMSRGGYPEARARPLVGKWAKDHAPTELWKACEAAWAAGTLDPASYVTKALANISEEENDPLRNPTAFRQRIWMQDFVAGAEWREHERGPRPGEPSCRVSPEIQREFGIDPAAPQPVRGAAA